MSTSFTAMWNRFQGNHDETLDRSDDDDDDDDDYYDEDEMDVDDNRFPLRPTRSCDPPGDTAQNAVAKAKRKSKRNRKQQVQQPATPAKSLSSHFNDLVREGSLLKERTYNPFARTFTEEESERGNRARASARGNDPSFFNESTTNYVLAAQQGGSLSGVSNRNRGSNYNHKSSSNQSRSGAQNNVSIWDGNFFQNKDTKNSTFATDGGSAVFANTMFTESTKRYEKTRSHPGPDPSVGTIATVQSHLGSVVAVPNAVPQPGPNEHMQRAMSSPEVNLELGNISPDPPKPPEPPQIPPSAQDDMDFSKVAEQVTEQVESLTKEFADNPGMLFFLYIYMTGTIYGSMLIVSTGLFLISFVYASPFDTERERDFFQLACLAFTAMFGWVLTSMWISYKERQYGWAFISSLPSIGVIALVVVVLTTGCLPDGIVPVTTTTPAPTWAPRNYYNRADSQDGEWNGNYGNNYQNGGYNYNYYNDP